MHPDATTIYKLVDVLFLVSFLVSAICIYRIETEDKEISLPIFIMSVFLGFGVACLTTVVVSGICYGFYFLLTA